MSSALGVQTVVVHRLHSCCVNSVTYACSRHVICLQKVAGAQGIYTIHYIIAQILLCM